jgi:gluconate 2-dehydrogenase gamma chain
VRSWSRGATRRDLMAGTAAATFAFLLRQATGAELHGMPAWDRNAGSPPTAVKPGPWQFFTPEEAVTIEALVDRLIPPDPHWPGGKDAGCAVFIDRQLAGPYGSSRGLYMRPPFQDGDKQQGPQSPLTPAMRYRQSLAAFDTYCRGRFAGKAFVNIPADQQDAVITGMEKGSVVLPSVSARGFFDLLLQNTKEGFFADPVYGGNRDMAAWRMIGFPGARYDYRDWVEQHNQQYPRPPVGIGGRPEWTVHRS